VAYLASHKLASSTGVFIGGISRGGFLAAHYAARAPAERVAAVGLLSPVTNLSLLTEFAGENASMQRSLRQLDIAVQAPVLASKNIFALIGDEDPRVFTDSCVDAMRTVQCHGCGAKGPFFPAYSCSGCPTTHGDTQLRVYREPGGHTVPPHEDPALSFSDLASWVLRVTKATKQ
jgi:pimeloyl-ACP methyl ester carboxylesterase